MTQSEFEDNTDQESSPAFGKRKSRWLVAVDLLLVLLLIGGLAYVGSTFVRLTQGVAMAEDSAQVSVRLQVVNGSGDRNVTARASAWVSSLSGDRVTVSVVDSAAFSQTPVVNSFVVSRDENPATAIAFAHLLGIGSDEIVTLPLAHNQRLINVSLVIGRDYKSRFPAL